MFEWCPCDAEELCVVDFGYGGEGGFVECVLWNFYNSFNSQVFLCSDYRGRVRLLGVWSDFTYSEVVYNYLFSGLFVLLELGVLRGILERCYGNSRLRNRFVHRFEFFLDAWRESVSREVDLVEGVRRDRLHNLDVVRLVFREVFDVRG